MLVIRMQRTGRKGHAMFRVVVQDARRTPTSGNVVAQIGHYDPHTKEIVLAKDKAAFYLEHGAQPSPRVTRLLKAEGVKLPAWVAAATKKSGTVRNPDKFGTKEPAAEAVADGAPAEPVVEEAAEAQAEASEPEVTEAPAAEPETTPETAVEAPAETVDETKTEESADKTPTEA